MPCIVLELNGAKRLIESGKPYRLQPGEVLTGVDENCGGNTIRIVGKTDTLHDELALEVGPGMGDWIRTLATPIATVMGKKGCTTCEARRIVTNAYGQLKAQHGQLKALGMMKDLWMLSMKAEGDEVLARLKEMLNG